jgi:hypothetical protein
VPAELGLEAEMDFATAASKLISDKKKELWDLIGKQEKILREDMCLHPGADHSGAICNSHSIQQNKLQMIARAGHVYVIDLETRKLLKQPPGLAPTLLGISNTSVFRGFCSKHDEELFRPIDTQDFKGTAEQLFLYFYRAICRELHVRHCTAKASVGPDDIARVHPDIPKHLYEEPVGEQQARFIAEALKFHLCCKSLADAALSNAEFRRLKHYIITFKSPPSVLSAAATTPTCDFSGKGYRVVSDPLHPYPIMTVTAVPTSSGGVAIMSWFDTAPVEFDRFCSSLDAVPANKLTSAIIRFLFEFCENIAINPNWWDPLPAEHKESLLGHVRSGITIQRTEACLADDGICYDDWQVERRFRL